MADKWEYFTTFLYANAERSFRDIQKTRKNAGKFAPEAMVPDLNAYGDQGWELVHMQPVFPGKNDDVMITCGSVNALWTQWYFCAFKRRKP